LPFCGPSNERWARIGATGGQLSGRTMSVLGTHRTAMLVILLPFFLASALHSSVSKWALMSL